MCTQIVQQDEQALRAQRRRAVGSCFFQSMHRPIACDSEEDNHSDCQNFCPAVSQGGREPKKERTRIMRRLSRGDLRGRFISRAPTSSPHEMSILYTVNCIRARRAARRSIDRSHVTPRRSRPTRSGVYPVRLRLEDANPSSHVGVHESLGQRGGAVPDAAVLRGADASREGVTDEALAVDIRTNAERDKDEASAHRATSGETPPNSIYHRRIPHRLSGDVSALTTSTTPVVLYLRRYETRRLEASVTFGNARDSRRNPFA